MTLHVTDVTMGHFKLQPRLIENKLWLLLFSRRALAKSWCLVANSQWLQAISW